MGKIYKKDNCTTPDGKCTTSCWLDCILKGVKIAFLIILCTAVVKCSFNVSTAVKTPVIAIGEGNDDGGSGIVCKGISHAECLELVKEYNNGRKN